MTASRIFLSHSGSDAETAGRIASALRGRGIEPLLDRESTTAGDSFISFIENALSTSDYFLLMWSRSAAERAWVRMEWEAALHRSVAEARAFLFVGRLDNHPVPALLAPRLFVSLFPDIEPGLSQLVNVWTNDRAAGESSQRPVAPGLSATSQPAGTNVYITSDLFGITCPWGVDLQAPAGMIVNTIRDSFHLPTALDHQGRVGVRFEYHLAYGEHRLSRTERLVDRGIGANSVLWLECEMIPIAAISPRGGALAKTVFRGNDADDMIAVARKHLIARVNEAGLGLA